jgi:radical SAM superfamily enzyme YgiQ (UPF0313 family)
MKALLISTYDMGRQPFGLASPAAWLKRAGWEVTCFDIAKQKLDEHAVASAQLIAFHLPMHTATRLAAPIIDRVRRRNPGALICAYGLYAPLNEEFLRRLGVEHVIGGEFEAELTRVAQGLRPANNAAPRFNPAAAAAPLPRLEFIVPDRSGLPPLTRYASLHMPDGSRQTVGYTEASRGCKHLCRHCPVVPIYQGQFRVVQADVVLADIDAQIGAGAQHMTFGDPDFLNGPAHARRVVSGLHARHPRVTYDVTIKVEHLLAHRDLLPHLAGTGCAFIISAVESLDDRVLGILHKGHTRAGFIEAVALCRDAGIALVPTFVAFHPWLTLDGYCDLLDTIAALDLIDHVAPIQLGIRLLVPQGSHLVGVDEMREHLGPFDPHTLTYRWRHPDPRVDALHAEVSALIGARVNADRDTVFSEISRLAHDLAGTPMPDARPARDRATVPYLNEPWYC